MGQFTNAQRIEHARAAARAAEAIERRKAEAEAAKAEAEKRNDAAR
jgi:hypothetical protein